MRITPKIAIILTTVTTVVLGAAGAWDALQGYRQGTADIANRAQRSLDRLTPITGRAIYNIDAAILDEAVKGELADDLITTVLVHDTAKNELFTGWSSASFNTPPEVAKEALADPLLLRLEREVPYEGKPIGTLVMQVDPRPVHEQLRKSIIAVVVRTLAINALLVAVLVIAIQRSLVRPLRQAIDRMRNVAEGDGDLTARLPADRRDELGELARTFNHFAESMRTSIVSVSQGTAAVEAAAASIAPLASELDSGAGETTTQATAASNAAANVSDSVGTVSAATGELQISIAEISRSVQQATTVTRDAVATTAQAGTVMGKLETSSVEIGKVIALIANIAGQVNLLALNATIEAARAGEAGRGFAVVAGEVKNLAGQTAKASSQIGATIQAIQQEVTAGLASIRQLDQTIRSVDQVTQSIAAAIEEQNATTSEITRNVGMAAEGVTAIATGAKQVVEVASRTSSSAQRARSTAEELTRLTAELRGAVARFRT